MALGLVELIAAGMSNLTYVVTPEGGSDDDAVILRRPPTGAVLATAHDMVREHRVISALGDTAVPVPRTLHLCTDTEVLGAPFYVMERVQGIHVVKELPARVRRQPGRSAARWPSAWSTCSPTCTPSTTTPSAWPSSAGRRASPPARCGAGPSSGTPPATGTGPGLDALAARLAETVPATQRSSIVHGDYRLDNCLLDPSRRRAGSRRSSTGRCRPSATRSPTSG